MRRKRGCGLAWAVVALLSAVAVAGQEPPPADRTIGLTVGVFDFDDDQDTSEVGVDVAWAPLRYGIRPAAGLGVTGDDAYFVYAGARRDFPVGEKVQVSLHFGVSFFEEGDGKVLGHEIEFRSGLEVNRSVWGGGRLGLGIFHLSNGSISKTNPGANSLLVRYVVPLRRARPPRQPVE